MLETCLLILFVILLVRFLSRPRRNGKPLPEPKGLPFFGLGFQINQNNITEKVSEFAEEYGDIFQMNLFQQKILCLNSTAVIKDLLLGADYKRHTNNRSTYFFGEHVLGKESIAFVQKGFSPIHNKLRKGFTKAVHIYGEGMEHFEQTVLSEINELNKKIAAANGDQICVVGLFQHSLTQIISITLCGEPFREGDTDIRLFWDYVDAFNFFLQLSSNVFCSFIPWIRFIPSVYKRKYDDTCTTRDRIKERFFTQQKETFQRGRVRGAIDVLLEEQLLEKESGKLTVFTDQQILVLILEIIAAGIVTTWSALSSTMLCLVHHPEYQDRIYKQLMDVIRDTRDVSHSDKKNCPLVEALELEAHRLLTVGPLLQRDISGCKLLYKGYTLPAKATLLCNIKRIHHDEKTWGDPWNFRPDRFLDDNGQLLPRDHPLRQNLLPFGLGRRSCVGEPFARSRYFLYMATLLRDWRFMLPPGQHSEFNPQDMELFDTGVLVKPKPFNVVARKR